MVQLNLFGDDSPPEKKPAGDKHKPPAMLPVGNPWDLNEFLKQCTPGERRAWERTQQQQAKDIDRDAGDAV